MSLKFLNTVLLAALFASYVDAAPWPGTAKHPTHRVRTVGRGLKVEAFHPKSSYEVLGRGLEDRAEPTDTSDLKSSAEAWVQNKLGLTASNVAYKSGFSGKICQYAYMKQLINDIPVSNAVANVAFKDGKAVAFGSSFVNATNVADSKPTIDLETASKKAEEALEGKVNDWTPTVEYVVKPDGSVALAHVLQVQNTEKNTWHEAFVDAHNGELISVTDFVAEATYTVLRPDQVTLLEGAPAPITDPEDLLASPQGWHSDGRTNFTTTQGNNVVAFTSSDPRQTVQESSNNLVFDFDQTNRQNADQGDNVEAAVTNAFFLMNTMHDITYRYGFTEKAFNFQDNNFGLGGAQGDKVLMSVQDPSGVNNAAFSTPPDGQSGICQMFIWTLTNPTRDGSLENDIPIHEMTHGVTNRMTGGGTGRCLQTTESGGMGEGWSDAMSNWMQQKTADTKDFQMGQFVINSQKGIRSFPYSTSAQTNPLRYSSIQQLNEVHNIGEVWANMLHNVYAALVAENGFSDTAKTNPDGNEGNVIFMHLMIDALALQPCNPTFVQARDAWVAADQARFNGANTCTVLKAFASRGLGLNAGPDFEDDDTIPRECQ